jgi:hypothetical protein
MLHELWDDPANEGRWTFCVTGIRGDEARVQLSPDARLVWTVEANSHFEAMTRYWKHQGWGVYSAEHEWDRKTYAEHGWQ